MTKTPQQIAMYRLATQGWAWHRLDTNNVDKSDDILQIARTQGLDFLALPDTHSEATWVSVNHKHGHAHTHEAAASKTQRLP